MPSRLSRKSRVVVLVTPATRQGGAVTSRRVAPAGRTWNERIRLHIHPRDPLHLMRGPYRRGCGSPPGHLHIVRVASHCRRDSGCDRAGAVIDDDEARVLRYARGTAAAAYLLGGGAVLALAILEEEPGAITALWAVGAAVTFVAVAVVANRLRKMVPGRVALRPPGWRDLWPDGLVSAPLYTGTAAIGLYSAVSSASTVMTGHFEAAMLPAAIAATALVLHRFVPEVAIKQRSADVDVSATIDE